MARHPGGRTCAGALLLMPLTVPLLLIRAGWRRADHTDRGGTVTRRFGPKSADHPSVGQPCAGCSVPFAAGDYTTLVLVGPGSDGDARERARDGRPYDAVAVEAHWVCVTGEPDA